MEEAPRVMPPGGFWEKGHGRVVGDGARHPTGFRRGLLGGCACDARKPLAEAMGMPRAINMRAIARNPLPSRISGDYFFGGDARSKSSVATPPRGSTVTASVEATLYTSGMTFFFSS